LQHRNIALDVIRAVAILLVLCSHLPKIPADSPFVLRQIADFLRIFGHTGVDLFFVLSGMLVSGLLFKEYNLKGRVNIARFLVRRGLKLYPAFYFFLLVSVLIRVRLGGEIGIRNIIAEVLFVQNYFEGVWSHTWSLAVEEHFYLLLAIGIMVLAWSHRPRPFDVVPLVYVVLMFVVFYLRFRLFTHYPFTFRTHRCPTHLQIDSLMFGVVLSYAIHFWRATIEAMNRQKLLVVTVSSGILLVTLLLSGVWAFTLGHVLLYVGFGGFVLLAASGNWTLSKVLTGLGYVGAHSYSIYLWHTVVLVLGRLVLHKLQSSWHLSLSWEIKATIYILIAIGFGILLSKIVEIPVLNIRDRLFPSGTQIGSRIGDGKDAN
jgi:peptidoglycan/LPS O-acetylase OafA/YrhL